MNDPYHNFYSEVGGAPFGELDVHSASFVADPEVPWNNRSRLVVQFEESSLDAERALELYNVLAKRGVRIREMSNYKYETELDSVVENRPRVTLIIIVHGSYVFAWDRDDGGSIDLWSVEGRVIDEIEKALITAGVPYKRYTPEGMSSSSWYPHIAVPLSRGIKTTVEESAIATDKDPPR